MKIVNYTDFRKDLARNLNAVNNDSEVLVVARPKNKNVVVMSMEEYNSIQETLHLTNTSANRKRLLASLEEMNKGKFAKHKLAE